MSLQECFQGVSELHTALSLFDQAGTHLTESLVKALEHTAYKCVGDVLGDRMRDVFTSAACAGNVAALHEVETMLTDIMNTEKQHADQQSYEQALCHVALLITKIKKQYFAICHCKMVDLVHALLCLKGEDPTSGEVTKLVLKLGLADGLDSPYKSNASLPNSPWGSPKLRKSLQDSDKAQNRTSFRIMSLFERKTPPDERKISCYVDVEESSSGRNELKKEGVPSVTVGSHEDNNCVTSFTARQQSDVFSTNVLGMSAGQIKNSGPTDLFQFKTATENPSVVVSSRPQLATEEVLESVINLLSGVGCGSVSPMQVIPEVMPPQGSMQLTVPKIYRNLSPVSDIQLDEHRKSQVHRRSEGCLDLSAMGRNIWPHQHQHHHRASLPSVQIFTATGHHRPGYDPPSPVPSYIRDSPSPSFGIRDSPSPGYFQGDPPSPFRTHYTKTLGVGVSAIRPNMLSPMQWLTCPPGNVTSSPLGSFDPSMSQNRTWPMYGGTSSVSPSVAETSSWLGTQDCSDLSDDSSTEDQFFAVGKDLSHAVSSKDGSSDEERDSGNQELAKSSSTWPPLNQHSSVNRGLTPELLEPPEIYNTHKPIQMQWSDPLSSRSMWQPSTQDSSHYKTSQSMQGFGGAN